MYGVATLESIEIGVKGQDFQRFAVEAYYVTAAAWRCYVHSIAMSKPIHVSWKKEGAAICSVFQRLCNPTQDGI